MCIYDKIYEAINTGIHKALVLPDEISDDTSIRFAHKKISNAIDRDYYVREFENADNESDILNYYDIIKGFIKNGYMYKPANIWELSQILSQLHAIKKSNFKWIDTADSLTVISENNMEMTLSDYAKSDLKSKFLRIRHGKGDFVIYKTIGFRTNIQYSTGMYLSVNVKYKMMENALDDFSGFENTYSPQIIGNIDKFPIFKDVRDINESGYKAYIPALGELNVLLENIKAIRYALTVIDKKENSNACQLLNNMIKANGCDYQIWSSTEMSNQIAWTINGYMHIDNQLKISDYGVKYIPFFKKSEKNIRQYQ